MKHALYIIILAALLTACSYDDQLPLYDIEISVQCPTALSSGIPVTMTDGNATRFTAETDANGTARFHLPTGNSVNYADSRYYCMYDPSTMGADGKAYANTAYYPSPSEVIPTRHYLKTVKYGMGNAWPYSVTSPATVIFQTEGTTVAEYANNPANIIYPTGKQGNLTVACLSIPRSWVLDGVEVYNADKLPDCKKRLTSDIDNGYIALTHGYGHSLLRRIDEQSTQQAGHTVYIDTNNSTNDFIETEQCSIK